MSAFCNVGIDVSKDSFDLYVHETSVHKKFQIEKEQINEAVAWLCEQHPTLIVLEATGGYEHTLVTELVSAELSVAVVNPRRIRDFAKAIGKLAKTDKVDAAVIAMYAATIKPDANAAIDEQREQLAALTTRRRQLVNMRAAEKNHKEHARLPKIRKSIDAIIQNLTSEIKRIEAEITKLISKDPDMRNKTKILSSVPGIGPATAAVLVADLPELGTINRKEIAALVGVAPMNRDSGQFRGKRMTGSGRKHIRTALFMAMLSIIQFNKPLKTFYDRLVKQGKAKMVALVAAMRKLLTILNTMLKSNASWAPKFG